MAVFAEPVSLPAAPLEIFQGVTLETEERTEPRPLRLYWVEADLDAPGVAFEVSPGNGPEPGEASAALPAEQAREHDWQVVMNGDAFSNPDGEEPLFYTEGMPVDLLGLAVSDGETYSQPHPRFGYFYQDRQGRFAVGQGKAPGDVRQAVAGFGRLIDDGKVRPTEDGKRHPRSAIGYDPKRNVLIFLVVDGRQPGVSEGASRRELAEWLHARGAREALNLDGGGSSLLAIRQGGRTRTLNRPVGLLNQPGTVRPVGNCVGLKARELK
ncbi:MAG: phosphodiester glycosidase family protein [Verrucomicrobiota bacterium]